MRSACLCLVPALLAGSLASVSARLSGVPAEDSRASQSASSSSSHRREEDVDDGHPPLDPPSLHGSLIVMQFTDDPHERRDKMEMILTGELGLASVRFRAESFGEDGGEDYSDVTGDFCAFDPTINKADPAAYPTAGAVMGTSDHCSEHSYTMDLREVMRAVNERDASGTGGGMKRLPLSGMVLHEGYSGAGLVSNALATFDTAHVVSEHAALHDALGACDVIRNRFGIHDCSAAKRGRLVRDVVALLSRTPSSSSATDKLYLKMTSGSTAYLPELRSLFPESRWVFVYRDPAHALAKASSRGRSGPCLKSRRNPSAALSAKVAERGIDLEGLSDREVCALHLSTLLDAASEEHERSGTGMLVSYDDVILKGGANGLLEDVLPYLGLGREIDADEDGAVRARVSQVLATRSNVGGGHISRGRRWDGETVEVDAEVGGASEMFMREATEMLASLSSES